MPARLFCLILTLSFQLTAQAQMCRNLFTNSHIIQAPSIEYKGAMTFSTSSLEATQDISIQSLTNPFGAIGYAGPLGPLGPINKWGAVGDNINNASSMISSYEWSNLSNYMSSVGGPLSKNGVFGTFGANKLYFGSEPLQQGSPLMILGQDGVLGPYGLLGALGPNGAHGLKRDPKTCVYQCTAKDKTIETKSEVLVDQVKPEDLVELYTQKSLEKMSELTGRFAVDGKSATGEVTDFNYKAKAGDFINFLVSPSGFGDRVSIEILDKNGNSLAASKSKTLINFIVFQFQKEAQVTIRIKNEGRSPYYNPAIETMQAFNPFAGMLPKSPFLQTNEWRLHVITSPVKTDLPLFSGTHWTQFD